MPADLTQDILNSDVITLLTRAIPNPELQVEESANDSDKTITIPSTEIWEILWIYVYFVTTGTVGSRYIQLSFLDDSDDIIFFAFSPNAQVASTGEYYTFYSLGQEHIETSASRHFIPIPPTSYLPPGYKIRIRDGSAVDAAADDLNIQMMVNRYDV